MRKVIGVIDLRLVDKDAVATAYVTRVEAIGREKHFGVVTRDGGIIQHNHISRVSSKGVTAPLFQENGSGRCILTNQHQRGRRRQRAQNILGNETRDAGV